ncbi:MAG: exosortase-associated EpsI family protein [Gemmataceae bacterium]
MGKIHQAAIVILVITILGMWRLFPNDGAAPALAHDAILEKLHQLPARLPSWYRMDHQITVNAHDSCFTGEYVHKTSNDKILVYLTGGKAGVIATHTPDLCYRGSGYQIVHDDSRQQDHFQHGAERFNVSHFQKTRSNSEEHLTIYWAWHDGQRWDVPVFPRFAYARCPYLIKGYFIVASSTERGFTDKIFSSFAEQFLPAFH